MSTRAFRVLFWWLIMIAAMGWAAVVAALVDGR
jgi:hypothetical protein